MRMTRCIKCVLLSSALTAELFFVHPALAQTTAPAAEPDDARGVPVIIVTAQKREERLLDVGMSIQALGAEELKNSGITAPSDLSKVVPGFSYNDTLYGAPVYTIRGIGFQETTLSASPTVTTYVDEVPISYPLMTLGTTLDVGRLEVLKGPQGTLFGQNSTGGALNFVTARPTDTLSAGIDLSYGSFDTVKFGGFLSGPILETLKGRVSVDYTNADGWQKSFTRQGDKLGKKNFLNARLLLDWDVSDNFSAKLNVSAWRDKGETPAPQFFDTLERPSGALPVLLENYPHAPHRNSASDWDDNTDYTRNNRFFFSSLRLDYDTGAGITLTSLTSYQKYLRDQPVEGDGTSVTNYYTVQIGKVTSFYQELRASGDFGGSGNWVIGGNYGRDKTYDEFTQHFDDSSASLVFGLPFGINKDLSHQKVTTKAAFANVEYPVTPELTLQAGIRYTKSERSYAGCGADAGEGKGAAVFDAISAYLRGIYGITDPIVPIAPGACYTLGAAPTFLPGLDVRQLNEDNISWRAGINYKITPDTLVYLNVSRGYKGGSFPTISNTLAVQQSAATQESVLAYELGLKSQLLDNRLQLTAAAFYYDYRDKQIIGSFPDIVFGPLSQLVNVPKSRIIGFEVSAVAQPWSGMVLSPSVSYTDSKIRGDFQGYNYLAQPADFSGEPFPLVPKWQAHVSVQQTVPLTERWNGFIGGDLSYRSSTFSGFGQYDLLRVQAYTLIDLNAGVEAGPWRMSVWGRNVTNKWYWTGIGQTTDTRVRYTGMPRSFGASLSYRF